MTDPACRKDYLDGLTESIEVAKRLGCTRLLTQTGADTGASREQQHISLCDGLREAVPLLEDAGITLLVEPLDTKTDHPGYYLTSSEEAFCLIDEVGSESVKVLYDIYHQQISEGDLSGHILPNIQKIAHFHAAGYPGRHELNTGEIHYPNLFRAILEAGYDGYFGLEYFPQDEPDLFLRALIHQ